MKIIHMCGKRGLGDIVASTSYILDNIDTDTHIIFHYPANHFYKEKFDFIMKEFVLPKDIKITYEVDETWSTVVYNKALHKFDKKYENQTWYFSSKIGYGKYRLFKTQWKQNLDGPIGLVLNHKTSFGEELSFENYPLYEKAWDTKTNSMLESLIDNNKYIRIGGTYDPNLLFEEIQNIQICRKIIGFDTGWGHITNCMRAPYVVCRNKLSRKFFKQIYDKHPTATMIETENLFSYLD